MSRLLMSLVTAALDFAKRLVLGVANLLVPLHSALILIYCCLRWLTGSRLWYVDMLEYVFPWILIPTILLLPAAIYRRSRVLIGLGVMPAIVLLLTYGSLFLPRLPVSTSDSTFTVATYNIRYDNTDEEAIVTAIEAGASDVLVLRELVPARAESLRERLANLYPYVRIEEGCGFFSRYPIVDYEAFTLSSDSADYAQRLVLEIDGREVTFLSVHPTSPKIQGFHPFGLSLGIPTGLASSKRDADVQGLARLVGETDSPLVVLGDFNISDQHEGYTDLTAELVDSHREAGWGMGLTFSPSGGPGQAMWRIDLVLHSRDLVALSTHVGGFGGSDHRLLAAELAFKE